MSELKPLPMDLTSGFNLLTRDGVKEFLTGCWSEGEWAKRCNRVVAVNGRNYPDFWRAEIIDSGFADNIAWWWKYR